MSAVFCGQVLASTESATSGQLATSQCLSALPGRLRRGKFVLDGLGWKDKNQRTYYSYTATQMDSDLGCEVTCDVRTVKEYQLENCGIFEPPPFRLSRIVRDEWTAWHKLWRNLGATGNQIQCLILLDVEARIHEEAEEIEVWSPSYPRSLQTVWIGNNQQSVGHIQIHYSKPIAEILSSTHENVDNSRP